MKVVTISDIHGNYDALQGLHEDYDELWILGDLEHDIQIGGDTWTAMLANGIGFSNTSIAPHFVVNIQYTSGTTGNPRGVQLTHFNVVHNARFTANALSRFANFVTGKLLASKSLSTSASWKATP